MKQSFRNEHLARTRSCRSSRHHRTAGAGRQELDAPCLGVGSSLHGGQLPGAGTARHSGLTMPPPKASPGYHSAGEAAGVGSTGVSAVGQEETGAPSLGLAESR